MGGGGGGVFRVVHARGAIPNEEEDFATSGVGLAGEAGPSHFGVALVQTDDRPQGMPGMAFELDVGAVRALL